MSIFISSFHERTQIVSSIATNEKLTRTPIRTDLSASSALGGTFSGTKLREISRLETAKPPNDYRTTHQRFW